MSFAGSHNHHLYTGDCYICISHPQSVLNYTTPPFVCPCQFMPRVELLILSPRQPSTLGSVLSQSTSMYEFSSILPFLSSPHSTYPRPICSVSEHVFNLISSLQLPCSNSGHTLSSLFGSNWSVHLLTICSPQSGRNHSYSKERINRTLLFHSPGSSPCC